MKMPASQLKSFSPAVSVVLAMIPKLSGQAPVA